MGRKQSGGKPPHSTPAPSLRPLYRFAWPEIKALAKGCFAACARKIQDGGKLVLAFKLRYNWGSENGEGEEQLKMAKRVLLVDDSPSVVQAAYDQLEERGYLIDVAYNGVEALKRIEDAVPDLIIMDIEMPKLRGDEAAEQIRANPLWVMIPIIALTARKPETMGGRTALFTAYLIKPFGFDVLLKKVEELIGPASSV